jgi:Tfp pilus assembly protein PilV
MRESAMHPYQRGFSLLETIVGVGLLTGALVALVQLVAMSVTVNATAKHRILASIAAEQKLEEMRADPSLSGVADGLEQLNAVGAPVCAAKEPCEGVVYIRNWSVRPVASAPDALLLLQVLVRHARYGEVHLVTVRPRKVR